MGQGTVQEKPNYNDNSGADLFTYMKEGLQELHERRPSRAVDLAVRNTLLGIVVNKFTSMKLDR